MRASSRPSPAAGATLAVIGAGNIGSHLLPHLGRMDGVARVIIVDRDVYARSNLRSQSISAADLGRPKVQVMARRLLSVSPDLQVVPIHDRLENIPPAVLRADIWLTCLDSRAARQVANERVYRLGVPLWIDAGVQLSDLLARVSVYAPGNDEPCVECLWGEDDYRDIAQLYACDGTPTQPAPTNGISALGALAASLQALECQAALTAERPAMLAARELVIHATARKYFVTRLRRNTQCRFDHTTWRTTPLPTAWHRLADIAQAARSSGERPSLHVYDQVFVRAVTCPACQRQVEVGLVSARVSSPSMRCRGCGACIPLRWDAVSDKLALDGLPGAFGCLPVRALRLRRGDLVTLRAGEHVQHLEVTSTGASSATRSAHHG